MKSLLFREAEYFEAWFDKFLDGYPRGEDGLACPYTIITALLSGASAIAYGAGASKAAWLRMCNMAWESAVEVQKRSDEASS